MAFTTAMAFVCCGLSFVLVAADRRRLSLVSTGVAALFAWVTLGILILARPMGWKTFIYDPEHPVLAAGVGIDGRMSPNACLAFILTTACLFLIGRGIWKPLLIATLASVVLGIATIAFISYATGLNQAAAWTRYIGMALHTSVLFLLIAAALLIWVYRVTHERDLALVKSFPFFTLAVITLALLAVIVAAINDQRQMSSIAVQRALETRAGIDRFISATARTDAASRNYQLSADDYYLARIAVHRKAVLDAIDDLQRLDSQDETLAKRTAALRELSLRNFAVKDAQIDVRRKEGLEAVSKIIRNEPPEIIQGLRAGTDALDAEQVALLGRAEVDLHVKEAQMRWALLGCAISGIGLISLAFSRMYHAKQRLRRSHTLLEEKTLAATASYQRLQTIADNLPVLVAYVDRDLKYRFTNQTFQKWILVDHRSLIGKEIWSVLGEDAKAALEPIHRKVFAGERAEFERNIVLPIGERFIRSDYLPDIAPSGEVIGFYVLVTDLTHRHILEEQMEKARDDALAASKLKSDFMATMSHEIRTPLNGIIGVASHLLERAVLPEQKEMLRVLDDSAGLLLGIVNDVLDFARLEAGQVSLTSAAFDVRQLVGSTLASLQPLAKKKGLELSSEVDPQIDRRLRGDARRIRQVLGNLTVNALKFTDAGSVKVSVSATTLGPASAVLRFAVRDTGPGVSPEGQGRLFKPFVQLESPSDKRQGGTGLGLAISRELVAMMNGKIGLESEVGRGSEFWFILDLPWSDDDAQARPRPPDYAGYILVVDDDENDRFLTMRALEAAGYFAQAVGDAEAAISALRQPPQPGAQWDLLLADQKMPRVGGLELAKAIREDSVLVDIPIVLISGGPMLDPNATTLLGFEAFFSKPVTADQVRKVLDRRREAAVRSIGPIRSPNTDPAPQGGESKSFRILVADDNDTNRYVSKMMLSSLKVSLDFACDGQEALDKLSAQPFDAVLMDCQMPVMSGYEATRKIRQGEVPGVRRDLPVVAMTAFAMPGDAEKCLAAGMSGYLAKPVRLATLVEELNRVGVAVALPVVNRPVPAAPLMETILDLRHIKEMKAIQSGDGRSVWDELLQAFLGQMVPRLAALQHLAKTHNRAELEIAAHRFAGSCAGVGAAEMKAIALKLQRQVEQEDWPAALRSVEELHLADTRFQSKLVGELP